MVKWCGSRPSDVQRNQRLLKTQADLKHSEKACVQRRGETRGIYLCNVYFDHSVVISFVERHALYDTLLFFCLQEKCLKNLMVQLV